MPNLLIRDLPEPLKSDISRRAKASGRSLSDEVKDLIRKGLLIDKGEGVAVENAYDLMRRSFGDALLSEDEHAAFMDAVDHLRADTGRPEADRH